MVESEHDGQQLLAFVESNRRDGKGITGYEYAALVTNTDYEVLSVGQLYRDRADAENAFDGRRTRRAFALGTKRRVEFEV
jgi:hypothetical protein